MHVFNLSKPKDNPIHSISNNGDRVNQISLFPEAGLIVTAGDDKTLQVWDSLNNFVRVHQFIGHSSYVTSCDVDETSRIIGMDPPLLRNQLTIVQLLAV